MVSDTIGMVKEGGTVISAAKAKRHANAHLRAEGARLVAVQASRDTKHGVWVVGYRDPDHAEEMPIGGGLVVTDQGEVHSIGSTPDAVGLLMQSLCQKSITTANDVWSREGESLELLAETDPEEAAGLAAWAASRRPWSDVLGAELEKPYFKKLMRFVDQERRRGPIYPSAGELFSAFHLTPFESVKAVILGQDPYHQPGQANGLCFSVSPDAPAVPALPAKHPRRPEA